METPFCVECRDAGSRLQTIGEYAKADTPREALKLAYLLYDWLPLLDNALSNGSLKDLLNIPDALFVAAEMIPRIPDHTRSGLNRVDFFAYMPSGEVFRFHPGHKAKDDAHVQRMRNDSHLFDYAHAAATGVGSALHAVPPGFLASAGAPQPGVFAVTPAHLAELSRYDVQARCGRKLLAELTRILDYQPVPVIDITRGATFPWWLTVASASACSAVVEEGIVEVLVTTHNQKPVLIVHNSAGKVRVTFGKPWVWKSSPEKRC